jgi:diphosphomevalonate decarboxylase
LDKCIQAMRALRKKYEDECNQPDKVRSLSYCVFRSNRQMKVSAWCIHVASYNNFPTAAGLASSAAGFAALTYCLATVYRLPNTCTELSTIARQGSGSACRSLFGGFVAWEMGSSASGEDSRAVQIATAESWSDMHALICVVSDEKKPVSSTAGMQRTVETSPLLQHRIKHIVPKRMEAITRAIQDHDFNSFAELTMKDSDQFHAVCLDTHPPIFYLNDKSRNVIALVHELNRISIAQSGSYVAAYTFDAGPNPVIYGLERNMKEIVNTIATYFPLSSPFKDNFAVFRPGDLVGEMPLTPGFNSEVATKFEVGALKDLIHTKIGEGPRVLGFANTLLDETDMSKAGL